MLISEFKYLFHYSYKLVTVVDMLKKVINHYNRDQHYKIKVGNMFYSNMQLKSHYLNLYEA